MAVLGNVILSLTRNCPPFPVRSQFSCHYKGVARRPPAVVPWDPAEEMPYVTRELDTVAL